MTRTFKKTMSVIMVICMIISLMPVLTLQVEAAESGYWTDSSNYDNTVATQTEQNITITTAEQLAGLAVAVNGGKDYYDANNSRKYIITLGADIDLSAHYWVPIGTYYNKFSGTFNGNGHTISGMNVTGNYSVAGLFGAISSGEVKNVTVSGSVTITDAPRLPDYAVYVGGLVGNAFRSTLTACTSNVNVSVSYTSENSVGAYVGGLAGSSVNWYKENGVIASGCSATGSVNATNVDDAYCGGMFGQVESSGAMVLDCSATGNVTSSTGMDNPANYLGGFTGSLIAPSYNCFASGAVSLSSTGIGSTKNYIGGFAGWITPGLDLNGDGKYITDGAAYNCYARGEVSASGTENVDIGGFVGYIMKIYKSSNITNCWSAGSITKPSTGSVAAGGFFGSGYTGTSAKTDSITDCYWLSNGDYDTAAEGYGTLGNVTVNSLTMLSSDQLANNTAIDSAYSTGSGIAYNSKMIVEALNLKSEAIKYAPIWTDGGGCPRLNLAPAWIYTYIDGVAADVSGYVELYQDGELMYTLARSSNLSTSEYSTPAVNGNYDIYINGADSGENIYFGSESDKSVYLYTVSFGVTNAGIASKSTISAEANDNSISSGTLVFKNSKVVISAQGGGGKSYTYAWSGNGTSGNDTKTLTIDSLSSAVNASCTVTGSNVAPLPTKVSIGGTVIYSTTASEITSASVKQDASVYTLNCATAFTGGAGTAIYDSSTGTLTLNDAAVPLTTDASGLGLYSDGGDLIVELDGNNTFGISGTSNTIYDCYVQNGCLTVMDGAETGTGNLTIYSYNASDIKSVYGLRSDGDLNFESGNYHFIGNGHYCYGMDAMSFEDAAAYGSININGGSIDIDISESSEAYGIIANNVLNVNGGNIDVDVAGSAYGMYGKSVNIYGGATINISAVATGTDLYACGVEADSTYRMEGGTLTVDADAKNGYGLYCGDSIISGGTLSATGSTGAIFSKSITYNGTNTILSNTTPEIIAASTASGAVSNLSGIVFDSSNKIYTDSESNALTHIEIGTSGSGGATGSGRSTGGSSSSSAGSNINVTTENDITTSIQTFTATTGSDGVAKASVTSSQISKLIVAANEKATGTNTQTAVNISVNTGSGATGVSVTIPMTGLTSLTGSTATLTLSSSVATVTLDSAALAEIGKKASGDITITATASDTSALSPESKAAIGTRPVYDLKITSGNTTVSNFGGGTATVSVPYTPAAGENVNAIVVYYINASGELVAVANCAYDAKTGTVTFTTTHFSIYAVGYNKVSFSDVSDSAWYADDVAYLAARGIVGGTGDSKFRPDASIARAEFVTILARMSGENLNGYTTSAFSDVSTDSWYFAAVQWANKAGIASGYEGKFDPNSGITREQMAAMLYRYAKYTETVSNAEGMSVREFSDYGSISAWAQAPIQWAMNNSIISGNTDGSFAPAANATRAQTAKIIAAFMQGMLGG